MVSCQDVETRLLELLTGELPEDIVLHLQSCYVCKERRLRWDYIWSLMDRWEEEKPSSETIESMVLQVREDLRREVAKKKRKSVVWSRMHPKESDRQWLGFRLSASDIRTIVFPALIASFLFIVSSVVLHYGKAVHLCKHVLQEFGIPVALPHATIFFVVGCFYGLLPLLLVGLIFGRTAKGHGFRQGFSVATLSLLIAVPYAAFACRTFAVPLAFSMITGLAVGAFSGSVGGFYLGSRREILVQT